MIINHPFQFQTVQTVDQAFDILQNQPAVQCGFCTPGMVMSSIALLKKTSQPKRGEILQAISGNSCRCTGYSKIVKAVERVVGEVVYD